MPAPTERVFVDPASVPACRLLEASFPDIVQDLATLADEEWVPWFQRDAYRGTWKVFGLFHRGDHPMIAHLHHVLRRDLCPRTRNILARVPGLITAGFSWIEPDSHVFAHADDPSVRSLRIHLPLRVDPAALLRVEATTRGWELGRCVCFETSRVHEVLHAGSVPRVLLLCEVELARIHEPVLAANPPGRDRLA